MKANQVSKKWLIVAAGGFSAAIIFLYFYIYSPLLNDNFFPPCSFKALTGWDCTGCGGQRALHEILHFRFFSAFYYNPLVVLMIPLLVHYIFFFLRRFIYGIPEPNNFFYSWRFGRLFIILVVLFTVIRNV